MTKPPSLCLHGHFYQPPRENPWIEAVEFQESAAPYHDWNERIHYECYLPNAMARVLDDKGLVLDIVNNFERISFNFGPTLLSWLEQFYPETYKAILDADKASRARLNGHGNAIAQVYNHMILPLANKRDKKTQILWGIRDFQFRFGREPESLWLSETACNEETLEALIEAGLKYVILSPHQAEAVLTPEAPADANPLEWKSVANGEIDPKQPYWCSLSNDPSKALAVFFYDGPVSKAVGFEDLAFDSARFMDRLEAASDPARTHDQLVHVATDGETYGHHKPFADRVLAYLVNTEAGKRGWRITNYGEYLETHPPVSRVRLKPGENNEGTSWSCAHGVGRWKDHCGCRGGGPAEWNQNWRKPLREAFDWLRDELAPLYESHGAAYLKDVWSARDSYIDVVLDRSEESLSKFFGKHTTRTLEKHEMILCLKLLEMQRHAMLMYTSCGWFFTELSGLETVQCILYSARAVQLAQEISGKNLEEAFLERLSLAKSNVPEFADGRGVYERLVRPASVTLEKIASHYAICSIFDGPQEKFSLYGCELHVLNQRQESYGNLTLNCGRIRIASRITREEKDLVFVVLQLGSYDFRCSVAPFEDEAKLAQVEHDLFEGLTSAHVVELLRSIDFHFGKQYYSLKDLLLAERTRVVALLAKETIDKVSSIYEKVYEENRRLNEVYNTVSLPIPEEIRYATARTLEKRLNAQIRELDAAGFDPKKAQGITRLLQMADLFGVKLVVSEATQFLSDRLADKTRALADGLSEDTVKVCLNIQRLARRMNVTMSTRFAQNHVLQILKARREAPDAAVRGAGKAVDALYRLAADLGINAKAFLSEPKTSEPEIPALLE